MSRIFRLCAGAVFLLVSITAFLDFQFVLGYFSFLSPDGTIVPLMRLTLKLCLIALAPVGLVLILYNYVTRFLFYFNGIICGLERNSFLKYTLLIGLALRAAAVVFMPSNQWADFKNYDELGWEWAIKGGYYNGEHLTAYWPPAYPFLLSRIYLLFGHVPELVTVLNIILGLSIVLLAYLIARKVFSEGVARWTAVLMTLFPSQILFTHLLASEMLFTPLMLLSVWIFLSFDRKFTGKWYTMLLGGVLLGTATLTRVISKLLLVLIIPYWLWESKDLKRTINYGLLALIGFFMVVAPWMVRNHYSVGVAKINTNTGINLFIGNQPGSGMGYNAGLAEQYNVNDPLREAYVDSSSWHRAWEYILAEPGTFLVRGVMKVGFFYATDMDPLQPGLIEAAELDETNHAVLLAFLAQSYYLLVLLMALLGIGVFLKSDRFIRKPAGFLMLGIIVYWTGIHFVFYGMGRYHFPILPMLCAFAALAVKSIVDKRSKTC